jgi:hypothetical protein
MRRGLIAAQPQSLIRLSPGWMCPPPPTLPHTHTLACARPLLPAQHVASSAIARMGGADRLQGQGELEAQDAAQVHLLLARMAASAEQYPAANHT